MLGLIITPFVSELISGRNCAYIFLSYSRVKSPELQKMPGWGRGPWSQRAQFPTTLYPCSPSLWNGSGKLLCLSGRHVAFVTGFCAPACAPFPQRRLLHGAKPIQISGWRSLHIRSKLNALSSIFEKSPVLWKSNFSKFISCRLLHLWLITDHILMWDSTSVMHTGCPMLERNLDKINAWVEFSIETNACN